MHLAGLWNCHMTTILGHCAAELTANDVRDFLVAALNPFYLWYYMVPCHATPMKHADHHFYPRQVALSVVLFLVSAVQMMVAVGIRPCCQWTLLMPVR
jgi:hypothetical protein